MTSEYSGAVEDARNYYDSDDADTFYYSVWGGVDLHVGMYNTPTESIRDASRRTVDTMISKLKSVNADSQAIDLGGAYGGSARVVAEKFGCHVTSLNLSPVQNERARQQNAEHGMADQITVVEGDFENIAYDDNSFDLVWSQDSFLHSGNREAVVSEIKRILKPGGEAIFTDPMQSENASLESLQPVLDRIQLETMGSPEFYQKEAAKHGLELVEWDDYTSHLPLHYGRVKEELESRYEELKSKISQEYLDNMITGLGHWVENGNAGNLAWGILHFRLPA